MFVSIFNICKHTHTHIYTVISLQVFFFLDSYFYALSLVLSSSPYSLILLQPMIQQACIRRDALRYFIST